MAFVWSTWTEMLMKVAHRTWSTVVLSLALHPYTHSHTAYYKGQKVLTAYYPRLHMWHVWSRYFCSLSWHKDTFESDVTGCIITAVTSHPIDKTDGRQDSWQCGTKLVWAAVPSVVCCHDRGGFYYLHGCLPSLPGRIGLVLVSEEGGEGAAWVSWKWKDGLIRTQPLPLLSFLCPLWLGDWAYWLNFVHFSLKNRLIGRIQINLGTSLVQTSTDCWDLMLFFCLSGFCNKVRV